MEPEFVWTVTATGEQLNLPREAEDTLIAIMLWLARDAAILDSEVVLEDILDAEYLEP